MRRADRSWRRGLGEVLKSIIKGRHIMSEERKQINYAVVCVSEFAKEHNLSAKKAFQFLFEHKAIEFLKENYDIEHTLSLDDVLNDLLEICKKNGGVLV